MLIALHRFVLYYVFIRGASYYSWRQLMQRLINGQGTKNKWWFCLALNGKLTSLPPNLRTTQKKEQEGHHA